MGYGGGDFTAAGCPGGRAAALSLCVQAVSCGLTGLAAGSVTTAR